MRNLDNVRNGLFRKIAQPSYISYLVIMGFGDEETEGARIKQVRLPKSLLTLS